MKKNQLEDLIRGIIREVLNEYEEISEITISSSDIKTLSKDNPGFDTPTPSDDALTAAEKARTEREQEVQRRKDIRTAELKLKGVKKQTDYYNQQVKQNKLDVTAKEKELQNLKAGIPISSGGAGSISP